MTARTAVALAVAIVLIGYALTVRPLEARIAERYALVAAARATIDGGSALGERIAASEREQRRLQATLARYALRDDTAVVLQRFLETSNTAATEHRTSIRALDADPATTGRAGTSDGLFDELSLRLTLRGSYEELFATVRALTAAPLASRIALETLGPDDRRSGDSALVAVVHVVLLRLRQTAHADVKPN